MKNTARRILAALLMSSLILTSGISAIAATGAPAAASPAPAATESTAPTEATSNLPLAEKAVNNHSLPLQGEVAPKAPEGVSSNEASNEVSSNEASAPAAVESPIVLGETRATVNEAPVEVVTIEENATPLSPKAESTLSPELPLEGKLSPKATDEVLSDEVSPDEVSSNEVSPALTLTSTTYSGVTVEVNADEGVLPSDASLFVAEIKSRAGKQTAEDALGNTNIEYDDYMVLDIQIRDGQANEIEPDGNIRVNIMMDASKLPEDADESTLEIQHLAEDADGAVKAVETVADNGNMTNGSIGVNGDNVEAEFPVGSFSLFTITWRRYSGESVTDTKLVFEAYTMNRGRTQKITLDNITFRDWDVEKDKKFKNMDNPGETITIREIMSDNSLPDSIDVNGETYYFYKATYKDEEFDALKHDPWLPKGESVGKKNGSIKLVTNGQETGGYIPFGKGNQEIRIYYAPEGEGTLHEIETIDSTARGIEMHLFKFSGAPNLGGASDDGNEMYFKGSKDRTRTVSAYGGTKHPVGMLTQGLVLNNRIRAGEDYPRFNMGGRVAGGGGQLADAWFDKGGNGAYQSGSSSQAPQAGNIKKAQQVNRLFRNDIYRDYGYFYYGSDENGVELDENGNFHVYDEVVTSSNYSGNNGNTASAFYYRRGQFLPFNHIDVSRKMAETTTDMAGNMLDASDPLYKKPVYAVKENELKYNGWDVLRGIMYFGMSVETTFYQPVGGMVPLSGMDEKGEYYNPNAKEVPMMFRFNGDDDFWLFIDDVLVLDLGGVHDAQEGWINFQTGDIYFSDNGNYGGAGGWTSDQSLYQFEFVNYDGSLVTNKKYDGHSTIYDQFVKALGKAAADDLNWKGNTFADNTRHTMKIYYMEHGAGASNLRMMFNIPVEKVNDLKVGKSFTENAKPKEFPDDFVGLFEVYEVIQKNGSTEYTVSEKIGEIELNKETATDGTFECRREEGQAHYEYTFKNLPAEHKYIVVEKIYRTDIGYLNTLMNKSLSGNNTSMSSVGKYTQPVPTKRLMSTAKSAITGNDDPTHTFVSDVFVIGSKDEVVSPQLLEIENQYQTTLTVEKHVHSQNTTDKETKFQFRLYLKNTDGTPYTQPLGKPVRIGSLEWQQKDGKDDLLYSVPEQNYYEFTLKDMESITLAVPNGIRYLVAENVNGEFKVFRPFLNKEVVLRDDNDDIVFDANNEVLWQDAVKLIPETDKDLEGFKTTPEDVLTDDTKITFINERQIVRTGVALNSTPFMTMLAVVFMAGAGLCVRYLRKKAEEEGDLFD